MGFDHSEKARPDDWLVGHAGNVHRYYEGNNISQISDGKRAMHEAVESLVLNNARHDGDRMRFMSLPGKFWRFEFGLSQSWEARHGVPVYFTGFERDPNVIAAGAGYVPRYFGKMKYHQPRSMRTIEALRVSYFKTNRARWINMDVNCALTLNNGMFKGSFASFKKRDGGRCWMEWWLNRFTKWDAVWLDYFGPISNAIGTALGNLYYHCPKDITPVAVTVLKGRETDGLGSVDRRAWISQRLGAGIGTQFECLNYREYTEEAGATMCNVLGLLKRK